MKFSRLRNVVLGMLVMALMMTVAIPAMASVRKQTIDVDYVDIKLVVNGKEVTPKDANGNVVEPFAYNGTTYLPVRAVGEALGKSVRWEGETKTVHLGELPQATYLVDACKVAGHPNVYRVANHAAFMFDGKRYSQGFMPHFDFEDDVHVFGLGGKYESLTFDYMNKNDGEIKVYLDGELAQTIDGIESGGVQTVTVPLNYAQTVGFSGSGYVANAVLHGERTVTKPAPPANATYLVDVCDLGDLQWSTYNEGEEWQDDFGNSYTKGFKVFYSHMTSGAVTLNGKYKTLKVTLVKRSYPNGNYSLTKIPCVFSVDGETVKEIELSAATGPQTVEIPLNYGMKLEINGYKDGRLYYLEPIFFANAILE